MTTKIAPFPFEATSWAEAARTYIAAHGETVSLPTSSPGDSVQRAFVSVVFRRGEQR